MNFKETRARYKAKIREPYDKDLAAQIIEIRVKFIEYDLQVTERFTWKLLNDYLYWYNAGVTITAQRQKAVEAILKFGKDSLFWKELDRTKREREDTLIRVVYCCEIITKMLKESGVKVPRKLTLFLKTSLDFRWKLKVSTFSEKQWCRLWEVERLLGIYYEDLSPELNGEVWRLEALRKIESEGK
jgi:hypothetical protein